jgi:hypothetical protein
MRYHDIAARWAKNELPCPCSANRLYYEGATIYSYGSHFAIARLTVTPTGNDAVLFNEYKYSHSTSNHQSIVWDAISRHCQGRALIPVPSSSWLTRLSDPDAAYRGPADAASLFAHWVSLAEEELKAHRRKRTDWSKANCMSLAFMYLNRARQLNREYALNIPADTTGSIEEQLYLLRVKQALAA